MWVIIIGDTNITIRMVYYNTYKLTPKYFIILYQVNDKTYNNFIVCNLNVRYMNKVRQV